MSLNRLHDQRVEGRCVLLRVDFNVPLKDGNVLDDGRVRAALPTLHYLIEQGAKVAVCSHLGRPKGVDDSLRLTPVAQRLGELLEKPVTSTSDCIGPEVQNAIDVMQPGDVVVLENLRFHDAEKKNDAEFSKQLAEPFDLFVQDAFGSLHRAHASTHAITQHLPACAGLLVQKEVEALSRLTHDIEHPYLAIIGGLKAQEKIGGLFGLLDNVDQFIIGGGTAFTFLKMKGANVGKSIVAEDYVDEAKRFVEDAYRKGATVILPKDAQLTTELNDEPEVSIALIGKIPDDWMGVDIGPETARDFKRRVREAKTIFWAGPLGAFEFPPFNKGTDEIANAIAESNAFTVIGGGETAAAAKADFNPDRVFISTGGGAALEFVSGKPLPGLEVLAS
jgi:phosphoglycerate kinase